MRRSCRGLSMAAILPCPELPPRADSKIQSEPIPTRRVFAHFDRRSYIGQSSAKLSGERLKKRLEFMYACWVTQLFPLKTQEFHLSTVDETEVDGRKAVGILVKHENHESLKLFFDKDTHLLVKSQGKYKNPDDGKEYDQECVYSDYRDVQGTKQPFRCKSFLDKKEDTDLLVTQMQPFDKPLDEKLFIKP